MNSTVARNRPVEFVIAHRYRGPALSGNGGYVCGVVAGALAGPAEVTLHAPPPLETPLQLLATDSTAQLLHDEVIIATARSCVVEVEPRSPVSLREAEAASVDYDGFRSHRYPECFVCGTHRARGDGLRIYPGPTGQSESVASVWIPDSRDADADGRAREEFVWAALDCPGYYGLRIPDLPALLGRMAAHILQRPAAGDPCVVMGWKLGQDGRKHFAASALYSAAGNLLGIATATWIELRRDAS